MITYILFVIGFVILVKGADFIVDGGSAMGLRLKISSLIIGLTVVALGTSAPELMVTLFASASASEASQLVIGNIIGSNIANILLVLGVASLIFPIVVRRDVIWVQIPLSLLAVMTLGVIASDSILDNEAVSILTRSDGIILLLFFTVFLYYTIAQVRRQRSSFYTDVAAEQDVETQTVQYSWLKIINLITLGLLGLFFGGRWIVDGAIRLSQDLNWDQSFVGLTIVAVGTSLPELATSVVAAFKKNADIAVGNIVGSNIVNVFFILGVGAVIKPIPFDAHNYPALFVAVLSSLVLFAAMFTGPKHHLLVRPTGIVFLVLYALFIGYSVIAA
ncbi:calcium/sodium antiporter [Dehalogenimonas sp. THU2]|uniref:calcium/sodium antiporter n=1 Tax=Dehalogenimonas sp. THU2 TaxID=3151121 RepID=UPI003218CD4E